MATSTDVQAVASIAADGRGFVEMAGALYHGIPCRLAIAGKADVAEAGWAILRRIDEVFNVYRDDSELGRINRVGTGSHRVSPWIAQCLAVAREFETLSGGAWSATMLPLVRLWRAAARAGSEPDTEALVRAVDAATDAWSLEGDTLHLVKTGAAFDLGGLAKGFAVDLVAEHLLAHEVTDFLVQVGGETVCLGRSPTGAPHRLGIPHPNDPDHAWCAVLRDPGTGFCGSTSGDYRQGLGKGPDRAHHILDPRTGRPADSRIASVTCIYPGTGSNARADGLTTALTVLGPAVMPDLCASQGCTGMALRRDGQRGMLASHMSGWGVFVAKDD